MGKGEDNPDFRDPVFHNDGRSVMDGVVGPEYAFNHFHGYAAIPWNPLLNKLFQILFSGQNHQGADTPFRQVEDAFGNNFHRGFCWLPGQTPENRPDISCTENGSDFISENHDDNQSGNSDNAFHHPAG